VSAATLLTPTGVPSLKQAQWYVKRLTVKAGGYMVQNVLECKQLCIPLWMPPNVLDLTVRTDPANVLGLTPAPLRMLAIPLEAKDFSVSGECFTGPQQIKWIGQLGKIPFQFVLHIDGK
jgi:hypothetical protein